MSNGEIISKLGSDFNYEEFKKMVFNNYKEIQIAWMNDNIESVRGLLSDTIFNTYKTQLMTLSTKQEQNMMEDIEYIDAFITNINININKGKEEIETTLIVTCRDYIINKNTKEVLRGKKNIINKYYYKLVFEKSLEEEKTKVCPNCGAELNDGNSTKCKYCGTVIVKESNNYILVDKKMLKQEIIKK